MDLQHYMIGIIAVFIHFLPTIQCCISVHEVIIKCVGPWNWPDQTNLRITCPAKHQVFIRRAVFRRRKEHQICPTSQDAYGCNMKHLTHEFVQVCQGKQTCEKIIRYDENLSCDGPRQTDFSGPRFVLVEYRCDAVTSIKGTMGICTQRMYQGADAHVLSSMLNSPPGRIRSTPCFCAITVQPEVRLAVTATEYLASEQITSCTSSTVKVVPHPTLHDNGAMWVCESGVTSEAPDCNSQNIVYLLKYIHDPFKPNLTIYFDVAVRTSYRSRFAIQCGLTSLSEIITPTFTPPIQTTPTTATTAPTKKKKVPTATLR